MDTYDLIKFLHVAFVVIWLGGGFCLVVLGARANRANDATDLTKVILQIVYMTSHVFVPASLLTFLCGLILAWIAGMFGLLWVIIGLAGFVATFGLGIAILKPRSDKLAALIAKDGATPAAVEQSREFLRIAKFDLTMMLVIVADMALKPAPENYFVLLIMALAIVAAAVVFLRPILAPGIPQRA
jgi:uncharacterized membrane protein